MESRIRSLKEQHLKDLLVERQRFESQLSLAHLQRDQDRARLENTFQEEIGAQLRTREADLRRRLAEEQREEVDLVVSRLTADAQSQADADAAEHRATVERLQTRLREAEGRAEDSRATSTHETDVMRTEIASLESALSSERSRVATLTARLRESESALSSAQARLAAFESSRDSLRDELDDKYRVRLDELARERDQHQSAWRDERDRGHDARARADKLLADRVHALESKHAAELESVQMRVRHMVEKKELVIAQLRAENDAKDRRMKEIEGLMETV